MMNSILNSLSPEKVRVAELTGVCLSCGGDTEPRAEQYAEVNDDEGNVIAMEVVEVKFDVFCEGCRDHILPELIDPTIDERVDNFYDNCF